MTNVKWYGKNCQGQIWHTVKLTEMKCNLIEAFSFFLDLTHFLYLIWQQPENKEVLISMATAGEHISRCATSLGYLTKGLSLVFAYQRLPRRKGDFFLKKWQTNGKEDASKKKALIPIYQTYWQRGNCRKPLQKIKIKKYSPLCHSRYKLQSELPSPSSFKANTTNPLPFHFTSLWVPLRFIRSLFRYHVHFILS